MKLVISMCLLTCFLYSSKGDSLYSTPLEQRDLERRLENLEQVYPKRIDYDKLDKKPELIYMPKLDLKDKEIPFKPVTVVIDALVDTAGNVVEAEIFRSSGNEAIDSACLEVSLKAKFKPARHNGRPVRARVSIPFTLMLNPALE